MNTGNFLTDMMTYRMYHQPKQKFPDKFRARDKKDGRVFEVTASGYNPRSDTQLYTLRDVNNGEVFYETHEAYIVKNCDILSEDGEENDLSKKGKKKWLKRFRKKLKLST